MSENNSHRTDKEKEAVNLNLKEERMLAKALSTLNLEKSYVLKLLNLEKKQVKFGQKRMRDRVKTIRTHLEADDIAKMKTMEIEGRFKPEYTPINASGVIRILAAAKRLKLMSNEEVAELVEKDLKRPLTAETSTVVPLSRPMTPAASLRMRSRSLPRDLNCSTDSTSSHYETKKFPVIRKKSQEEMYDSLDDLRSASRLFRPVSRTSHVNNENDTRSNHVNRETDTRSSRPVSRTGARSHMTMETDDVDGTLHINGRIQSASLTRASARAPMKQAHALTTRGFLTARPNTTNLPANARLPPRTPRTQRPKTSLGIQSLNYSSHKVKLNPEERCRRESVLSTSSIGSEIAREKAAEVRKELLTEEQIHGASIEDKRQMFLTRIQRWVDDNPTDDLPAFKPSPRSRSRSPDKMIDSKDEELQQTSDMEWTKIKQCRYLRMDDADVDLSGVTTLVRDQMKQLIGLRAGAPV